MHQSFAVMTSDHGPTEHGSLDQRLVPLLEYAVLAPSSHNSQPWRFAVREGRVFVFADRSRRLAVADPEDRELAISCGAALFNLRLAMRHSGIGDHVSLLPNADDRDLLAIVEPGQGAPSALDQAMFSAIALRRSNRRPYEPRPLEPQVLPSLSRAAQAESCRLTILDPQELPELVELTVEANRLQFANTAFRRELASWLRSNRTSRRDGMPGYAHGMSWLESLLAPVALQLADLGKSQGKRDGKLLQASAAVAVLSTEGDTPVDWLHAGQALQAVSLTARSQQVWTSYVSAPLEVPAVRKRLQDLMKAGGQPQMLLRLGYADDVPATPRRPVSQVISE